MAHSFFRDSLYKSNVFVLYLTIFSNHFFNVLLMRLVCCSQGLPDLGLSHKILPPTSYLNCHTHSLTVLTTTRLSPCSACMWNWMSIGGTFSGYELRNSMLFELHIPTAFHFNWHWTRVIDSCEFKTCMVGGGEELSHDCVELVLSSFHFSNKKYDRGKIFRPSSYSSPVQHTD